MASEADIKNLADVLYASQTTGVATSVYDAALARAGVSDPMEAGKLLSSFGYKAGTSDFYEGSKLQSAPADEGLAVHYNAVQTAKKDFGYLDSSDANIKQYAGKIDPSTGQPYRFIVNDNVANAALIANSGAKSNLLSPRQEIGADSLSDTILKKKAETYDRSSQLSGGGTFENSLQWANLALKKPTLPSAGAGFNQDGSVRGFGQSNFAAPPTPDPIQQTVTDAVTLPVTKPTYGQVPVAPVSNIQRPEAGTFSSPLQTAGLSAVPDTITVRPQYTGTTMANLTMPSQGQQSIQSVMYGNDLGQTVTVTEINGQPTTYVPPGFKRMSNQGQQQQQAQQQNLTPQAVVGMNKGGSVSNTKLDNMYDMATKFLGYSGPKTRKSLQDFANSNPGAATKLRSYTTGMAEGGMVSPRVQTADNVPQTGTPLSSADIEAMSRGLISQTMQPIQAPVSMILPQEADFIAPTAGMTVPQAPFAESATVGSVEQASIPQPLTPSSFTPVAAAGQISAETDKLQAAQGQVSTQAQVQAAQQQGTSLSDLKAAQTSAIMLENPMQREIQAGELISGSAVDAAKVEALNSQIQAAEATPTDQATVQGQLAGLMTQFEGGNIPAWASGAMRTAMANLSARGLGASSMAGQAVIQATMESALPIAQLDAQTRAQFESQNLSNRQQTAMMAAQQRAAFLQIDFDQEFQSRVQNASRIADVANMNFTAEQQIALENSRMANTTNLQNLNNNQAMVMAEAAALANMDAANLNNRQQAAVQNAQNFMQMDLTNLNNEQQTSLFKSQQNIQALFTDQAAENAALQFNAASENQTKQFFSNLQSQTSQFNATQRNAMDQFNVNSVNAMRQFNSEVQQQRDLFNAQNGLVIAQANAQWRQNLATLNTSAQNESNMELARTINALTSTNLDNIWQRERDIMGFAVGISEGEQDRLARLMIADKELDSVKFQQDARDRTAKFSAIVSALLS
jgi:hypothetical protein